VRSKIEGSIVVPPQVDPRDERGHAEGVTDKAFIAKNDIDQDGQRADRTRSSGLPLVTNDDVRVPTRTINTAPARIATSSGADPST